MANSPRAAARYTPGSWLGVVRAGTVVLLPPDSSAALVESVWELLATGPQVHQVLDAVTSASGGSLARLPWFAIVDSRSAVQFFLRGEIDLSVDLPSGPVELSGRDVTTWTERRFAAANGFSLTVPGAAANGGSGAGLDLPLTDGVVLLQGLRVAFAPDAARKMPPAVPAVPAAAVPATATIPPATPPAAVAVEPPATAAVAVEPPATAAVAVDPAAAEAAAGPEDEILAAAEADVAAELNEHGASSETVLEFPGEDLELDGTLHEEPEPEPEPELEAAGHEPEPSGANRPAAPDTAEQEPTGSYDHLWEQTVIRNIEDAAVRADPDADSEPAVESANAEPAPGPAAAKEAAEPVADPAPAPEPPAASRPLSTGLIDSVPWHTGGGRPSPDAAPTPAPQAPYLPALLAPAPDGSTAQPAADDDHDGETIMKSDLAGAAPRPAGAQRAGTEPATGPMVLARVCPQGHANPSTYSQCGRCGEPLPGDGVQVRRPRLGRMRLSTGGLIDLDQSLIVGRQPSVSRVQGAVMPKLVQVASPSGDISRSHVEVRLEGWHVMLCDLKATNGTVLVREGQPPRRLAQGEMAILLDGDIAEVGDGISLRFEEIP